jgi:hypothetical protein
VLLSPELAVCAGAPATLIAPREPAALGRALGALAADRTLLGELGTAAAAMAADRTWPAVAQRHLALYADVTAPARAGEHLTGVLGTTDAPLGRAEGRGTRASETGGFAAPGTTDGSAAPGTVGTAHAPLAGRPGRTAGGGIS